MAYNWAHPSYVKEEKPRVRTKLSSANVSSELLHSTCKKIAQLTKVVYNLNTQIEDKDILIATLKRDYEDKLQRVFGESKSKIAKLERKELQLKEQIEALEAELYKVRLLPKNLPYYSDLDKSDGFKEPNNLLHLTERLEATRSDLQETLTGFETLHKGINSNLSNDKDGSAGCILYSRNDEKAIPKGNIQSLRKLCDTLEKENTLLVQKYATQLNFIRTQYEQILLEVQKVKLNSSNECNGTNFIKDLTNSEACFKKRLNELLLQLSDSEEQSERHQRKVLHLKEVLLRKDKQFALCRSLGALYTSFYLEGRTSGMISNMAHCVRIRNSCFKNASLKNYCNLIKLQEKTEAMREEIERLKQFQVEADQPKLDEVPHSNMMTEKTNSGNEKLEEKNCPQIVENEYIKEEKSYSVSKESSCSEKDDMSPEEMKLDLFLDENNAPNPDSPTNSIEEKNSKQTTCNKNPNNGLKKAKKEDVTKALREWKRKYKEAVKNHQSELKKKDSYLNKLWKERMIFKEKELKEILRKEKMAAIDEIIVQKAMDFEKAQKDWQNTVGHLLKQLTHLQNMLDTSEERQGENDKELSDIEKEIIELKIHQQHYEDLYRHQLYAQENVFDEKQRLALSKQEAMYKEREQEIRKQHIAELVAQEEANKINLEKIRLENEHKRMEEKTKLEHFHQAQYDALQDKLKKEKAKALEEQEKIFLVEIKLMQSQLDDIMEEIHQKEEAAFQVERQLKKELMAQKSEESKLHATIKVLQSELSEVSKELELKRSEVLCIRKEATQQIKNLENYWQNRLGKEVKKIEQNNREERQNMLHNFLKSQDMLKDKIFVLKSRLQSAEHFINHKALVDDAGNTRYQKKEKENGPRNFRLREDKRAVSLEQLSQEKSRPSTIDSRALLGIQKTVYERTILKPLSSPLLLRRHSTANTDARRHRSQSPTSAPVHGNTAVSNRIGLRSIDKRASWSGENIPSILLEDYSDPPASTSAQTIEKTSSCLDLPLVSTSEYVPFNSAKSTNMLTGHVCKPILECEEPLSIYDKEDQSHLYVLLNGDIPFQKHEFHEKLPLLESEL